MPFHAGSVQSINILPSILLQLALAAELELGFDLLEALLVDSCDEITLEDELVIDTLEFTTVGVEELIAAEVVVLDELVAMLVLADELVATEELLTGIEPP